MRLETYPDKLGQYNAPPAQDVVIAIPPDKGADSTHGAGMDVVWTSGLKECYKQPKHCGLAIVWPCGLPAKVGKNIGLSPIFLTAFFAITLVGDIAFTAIAWADVKSRGDKPHFLYNINFYYFVGKPPGSHCSTAAYILGVLFVLGMYRLRIKTQDYYGIRRRKFFDIYASLFCTCCSLAQMSKQVDFERTKGHNYQQVQQSAYDAHGQSGHVNTILAFRQ
uniref:Uncharacterized protein n=1 Tax=Globisporangium ultimum (strain ATCC 200006 / CBS 805.95 / DAOM BR144) TaxID=431595 RepID=K3X1I8_GLOUD